VVVVVVVVAEVVDVDAESLIEPLSLSPVVVLIAVVSPVVEVEVEVDDEVASVALPAVEVSSPEQARRRQEAARRAKRRGVDIGVPQVR
jgi:hypothetical protein